MTWQIRRRIARLCALLLAFGWGFAYASIAAVQTNPDLASLRCGQIRVGSSR